MFVSFETVWQVVLLSTQRGTVYGGFRPEVVDEVGQVIMD